MKIIRTSNDVKLAEKRRQMANLGCSVCPCCGERKKSNYYIKKGILNKGIVTYLTYVSRGIKMYKKDWYKCKTCGAEWESDIYED